jgi:hypothetical protein
MTIKIAVVLSILVILAVSILLVDRNTQNIYQRR